VEQHTIVVVKNIVTLPGTPLSPGTQIHNTSKLKKVPANKRAYCTSRASLITSGTGLGKRSPGGTVARRPTTTGVALKRLKKS